MLSVSIFFFPVSVSLPLFPPVGSPICLFSGSEAFMFVCGSLSLSPSLFLSLSLSVSFLSLSLAVSLSLSLSLSSFLLSALSVLVIVKWG